jgi:hypothetical protein
MHCRTRWPPLGLTRPVGFGEALTRLVGAIGARTSCYCADAGLDGVASRALSCEIVRRRVQLATPPDPRSQWWRRRGGWPSVDADCKLLVSVLNVEHPYNHAQFMLDDSIQLSGFKHAA